MQRENFCWQDEWWCEMHWKLTQLGLTLKLKMQLLEQKKSAEIFKSQLFNSLFKVNSKPKTISLQDSELPFRKKFILVEFFTGDGCGHGTKDNHGFPRGCGCSYDGDVLVDEWSQVEVLQRKQLKWRWLHNKILLNWTTDNWKIFLPKTMATTKKKIADNFIFLRKAF